MVKTNLRMERIVRYEQDLIGLIDKQLYIIDTREGSSWKWVQYTNIKVDTVYHICTTNDGKYLWIQTDPTDLVIDDEHFQGFMYKEGETQPERSEIIKGTRYYGASKQLYVDINRSSGKSSYGNKYTNVSSAGFYENGKILTVGPDDDSDHVRIVNNVGYCL